ncbi:DUF2399 domain-containing protein [Paenibacillus oenotherae]|uniref:DUF2399 domain-containing protein n=1 Tax=Paenibacillus oenotherae TaxID=1435645 RepID=A0ABS7D376_9BACL|nr:TIGR02679 domain-containing protein [Paenibacillus oenotherae]MBW7474309.1 DUF2399 domain-containing protein [Paenibacillus oenotherae]
MDVNLKEQAKLYFGKKEFRCVIQSFKNKIESLGKVGGTVKLTPTLDERKALEKWLDEDFEGTTITVSLDKFEKRLSGSRFDELTLWEVVELVSGEKIIPNKEREQHQLLRKQEFFDRLRRKYLHPYTDLILEKLEAKAKNVSWITGLYNKGDKQTIEVLFHAVTSLPSEGDFERLPIFSERITGDPHYFDNSSQLCKALELIQSEQENRSYIGNLSAEEEDVLLVSYGLAKDDLHSFVTCYGLEAYRDECLLQQWYWANEEKTVQNIPLRAMKRVESVRPIRGNCVFVIENSGVYSSVLDKLGNNIAPVVCTHGNFRLSGLILLDKIIKSGYSIFYSGDFDGNGISLAYFLRRRYGQQVKFWRMGREEYLESISKVSLNEKSIKRISAIQDGELMPVIQEMKKRKKAGYQEPLLEKLSNDIIENNLEFS